MDQVGGGGNPFGAACRGAGHTRLAVSTPGRKRRVQSEFCDGQQISGI
jgi:hypothetical protein